MTEKDKKESVFGAHHLLTRPDTPAVKRALLSLALAVIIFLALTYNLAFPPDGLVSTPYESIQYRYGSYGFRGNLYTFGIAALLYLWFRFFGYRALFSSRSLNLLAVLFGLLNAAALHLFYRNLLPGYSASAALLFAGQALVWMLLFLLVSRVILWLADLAGASVRERAISKSGFLEMVDRHLFLFAFLCILLGWLPWLVSYYPASMEWDVYDPIMRYLGLLPRSNHHPWFYACVVGAAYQLGLDLGDRNIGIFIYTVLRALAMAAMYARCAALQKKNGLPRLLYLLTILFFAVTPVWGAYAKHAFKDSIGAALFCWYVSALVEIVLSLREHRLTFGSCLEYSIAGLLGCLFRNNTVYVVLPVSVILLLVLLKRKAKLRFPAVIVLGLLLFQGYESYIFDVLQVEPGNAKEALSIPLQQTARTVRRHSNELTEEEVNVLQKYFYADAFEQYDPIISDPVKARVREEFHSFGDYLPYLRTWAAMGFRFPDTYVEAFIAHSSGYYAFTPEYTEAQRYGPASHSNVGMTVFNWVEDDRFESSLLCSYVEGLSALREALDNWVEVWHQIPVLNLTDMKPLYTWCIVLLGWLWFQRKEWLKLLPAFACTLMMLTCVASPVNDCFRYFAPVAAAFPALLMLLRQKHD